MANRAPPGLRRSARIDRRFMKQGWGKTRIRPAPTLAQVAAATLVRRGLPDSIYVPRWASSTQHRSRPDTAISCL
jgi:hypothetical protein